MVCKNLVVSTIENYNWDSVPVPIVPQNIQGGIFL